MTIPMRPDGVALLAQPWPEPQSGPAWQAFSKANAAITAWKQLTSAVRSDAKLSHEGKQSALVNGQGPAVRLLDAADALLPIAEGAAKAVELSLLAPLKPADVLEAARFAEIRAFFAGKGESQRSSLIRAALAEGDTEFLRALHDAPARFDLVPQQIGARIGEVLLSTLNPQHYREWQTLTTQARLARQAVAGAREYIAKDMASSDRQWQTRDEEEAMRARLRPLGSGA